MISRLGPTFITAGILLALVPATLRADATSEWESMRQQQSKNYQSMVANMPNLKERNLRDLLQVVVENKALVVKTRMTSTTGEGFMRVKVPDLGITGLVQIRGGSPTPNVAVSPSLIQLNLTDYTKPMQITTLSLSSQQSSYFSISKAWQFPSGYKNVTLIQQGVGMTAGSGAVQLSVNEGGRDGVAPVSVDLQAADFFTFNRAHPHETEDYIRPLLRELGQESVFAPDLLIAWQVFADIWKPDPEVTRQIQDLLPKLDVDDIRARWRAQGELEKLGREGAAVLIHLDRGKLSPEQNARVSLALAPYAQLPGREAARLRSDLSFLLDCLYSDEIALRKVALQRLRELSDPALGFDIDAAPIARAAAVDAMRKKLGGKP